MSRSQGMLEVEKRSRETEINKILLQETVDVKALRRISRRKGGFLHHRARARVWPKLLNINRYDTVDYRSYIDPHRDDTQVKVDVERSLWKSQEVQSWTENYRERRRKSLSDIMMAVLCRHTNLYYYQGYHDIVSLFLLVLEDDHVTFHLTELVSLKYLSDYMCRDFELVGKTMRILMILIKTSDSALYKFLHEAKAEPFFATSWLLTWFSHDLETTDEVARLFDVILCSHPVYVYYICAAYVIHLRSEILSGECDFASVHNILVRAPSKFGFPLEEIIATADVLFARTPVKKLKTLCDLELQKLIYLNRVALLCQPYEQLTEASSDWKLLREKRMSRRANGEYFPYAKHILDVITFWGWSSVLRNFTNAIMGETDSNSSSLYTGSIIGAESINKGKSNRSAEQQRKLSVRPLGAYMSSHPAMMIITFIAVAGGMVSYMYMLPRGEIQ
mmetsp:Transcript_11339/g.19028  ORF Transcript_11339/g.19028 Transcript_11339/m.19028 type:complete len:448 (-) Transcript_11339:58-1401(-)